MKSSAPTSSSAAPRSRITEPTGPYGITGCPTALARTPPPRHQRIAVTSRERGSVPLPKRGISLLATPTTKMPAKPMTCRWPCTCAWLAHEAETPAMTASADSVTASENPPRTPKASAT